MGNSAAFSTLAKNAQAQLTDLKPQLNDTFSDIWVEGTLIYNFQLLPQMSSELDPAEIQPLILQMLSPYLEQNSQAFPALHIEMNSLRPDASSLASFTIKPSELTTTISQN